ncbi:TetR/AcrR family transcriptional regulator [Cohnella soli]|uniref:TetR/AcrR family transcriptional regulator n=1 Tax=Cohnella soli TaxID=425005 RepID=A0ABW0I2X5_9BACL
MSRKKEAIVRAGRKLFLSRGINDVSMEQIAEAVPVTKMTLYNNFGSKEGLLEAVVDDAVEEILRLFDEAIQGSSDTVDALNRISELDFPDADISEAFVTDLQSDYPHLMARWVDAQLGRALPQFEQLIFQGQQQGQIRKELSPSVVVAFLKFMGEHVSKSDTLLHLGEIKSVKQQLATIFYHGILTDKSEK